MRTPSEELFTKCATGAEYVRNLTPEKIIEQMPVVIQPSVKRVLETAEWTKKKIMNIAGGILADEEQPSPERRSLSPAVSDVSTSCDGEDEIFPTVVRVPPAKEEQVKADITDAMRKSFPSPLGQLMKNEKPGQPETRKKTRRGEDVVVKKTVGNGEAWKREMSRKDQQRRKEIEKEWQEKEERSRDEEENRVMTSMTTGMFVPTLKLHLQASAREDSVQEHTDGQREQSAFTIQPVQGGSPGESSENTSKLGRADQRVRDKNSKENVRPQDQRSDRKSEEPQNIRMMSESVARTYQQARISERKGKHTRSKNMRDKEKQVEDSSDEDTLPRRKREFRGRLFPDDEEEMPFAPPNQKP